jgi:hypothetical protein
LSTYHDVLKLEDDLKDASSRWYVPWPKLKLIENSIIFKLISIANHIKLEKWKTNCYKTQIFYDMSNPMISWFLSPHIYFTYLARLPSNVCHHTTTALPKC